jgi:fumarylacetoacetase
MSRLSSWVEYPADHPFPIENLPYAVAKINGENHIVVAIGDYVLDVKSLASTVFPKGRIADALQEPTMNTFMGLGYDAWKVTREALQQLLHEADGAQRAAAQAALIKREGLELVLPANIGDYTDFYASKEHATNLGQMFRPGQPPLMENWLHLPVGYHGRASSIVVSGTPVRRPNGQKKPVPEQPPVFGPSMALDYELELATWVGTGNELGEPINVNDAGKHIFGFSLFNDWSARDIQKWEYVPLGPFLGKNFASTISPWIVTTFALEQFRVATPAQDPKPLPYLLERDCAKGNLDIALTVTLTTKEGESAVISRSNSKYLYWSPQQMLAHHTINGCNMRPGDVLASGTISGPDEGSYGSMIELARQGTRPFKLPSGAERKMFQDGDSVNITGACTAADGTVIGFGDCSGTILPARVLMTGGAGSV